MKFRKSAAIALCIFLISGCAYISTRQPVRSRNYALNVEEQGTRGSAIIFNKTARHVTGSRGYGLTEEFDRWETLDLPERDSVKEEIIYEGINGSMITMTYRRSKNSVPVFSKRLTFDISATDRVVIRHYKLKILKATDEYIRFIVLSDKRTKY